MSNSKDIKECCQESQQVFKDLSEELMAKLKAANEVIARKDSIIADMAKQNDYLKGRLSAYESSRIAYASEFDGDTGSIHENIRKLKDEKERLNYNVRILSDFIEKERDGFLGVLFDGSTEKVKSLMASTEILRTLNENNN